LAAKSASRIEYGGWTPEWVIATCLRTRVARRDADVKRRRSRERLVQQSAIGDNMRPADEYAGDVSSAMMTVPIEVLGALLPWFRASDQITITCQAEDLQRALEMATGGPAMMSTAQAAHHYGWLPKDWREWAEAGLIPGAIKDYRPNSSATAEGSSAQVAQSADAAARKTRGASWRLPKESCIALVAQFRNKARQPVRSPKRQFDKVKVAQDRPAHPVPSINTNNTDRRKTRRGPRS
jgi:hypothetical protein